LTKFFLVVREPRKNLGKMTKNGSSEIQKFSRENVEIFWWYANRDKICLVVRESKKVENRWLRARLSVVKVIYD